MEEQAPVDAALLVHASQGFHGWNGLGHDADRGHLAVEHGAGVVGHLTVFLSCAKHVGTGSLSVRTGVVPRAHLVVGAD